MQQAQLNLLRPMVLFFIGLTSMVLASCHTKETTKSTEVGLAHVETQQSQPTKFSIYLAIIPDIKLPYHFDFDGMTTKDDTTRLDITKLNNRKDEGKYYEPDPDASYAQLPGAYQGGIAFALFKFKVNNELTAIAYTFQKNNPNIMYYPFVELLIFNNQGIIKGRQVIASGMLDAEHTERTVFTISTPDLINTMHTINEYADSTRTGTPLNALQNKALYHIQPDGKIIENKKR